METRFYILNISAHPLVKATLSYAQEKTEENFAQLVRAVYASGAEENYLAFLSKLTIEDDNPFSRAFAAGKGNPFLKKGMADDWNALLSALPQENGYFALGALHPPLTGSGEEVTEKLAEFYAKRGFGDFISHVAFGYDGDLTPVLSPDPVRLTDLKGYEREKKEVGENILNFLSGFPYADMLLYGDRGTGKSSTVHAMINEYADRKLRLIELKKENLLLLPRLKTRLASLPMKFILFIDDFSLRENDERVSTLKAALQGSMEGHTDNVMIVATSNRRHVVEERMDTRVNSVHAGDSEQELLSLSDRFGITVLFSSVNKSEYLAIVRTLCAERGLTVENLDLLAERWALLRGGRSPRRARQFADYAEATLRRGGQLDF